MTIKGEAAKTQLSHIIDLHCEGTGLLHTATLSHNHILFFLALYTKCLKPGELPTVISAHGRDFN